MCRNEQRGGAKSGVFLGVLLMAVGTVLLLERIGLLSTDLLRHFWPLLWATLGAVMLTGNRSPFAKAVGVLLIVVGIGVELQRMGYIRFRPWDLWPVQLIALGGFMLWRVLRPQSFRAGRADFDESKISEFAMFGGSELRITSQEFTGGYLWAMFGGHDIDLTHARLSGDRAVIHADAICGGVVLRVPQDWRVTADGPAIFGGITSKTLAPRDGESAPHLVVKAFAMFGGVEVKN